MNSIDKLRAKHPTIYFLADLLLNIFIVVLLVYTVRTYLISPFQVYGPSMCDTLNNINTNCQDGFGEYLIVNKAMYYPFFGHRFGAPQRGDIIVFRPPHNEKDFYIKRIIGLPGETVKIQDGKVYVFNKEHENGWELPEDYLNDTNRGQTFPMPTQGATTYDVPKDTYFVLGDNRKKSSDSRTCFKGLSLRDCDDKNNHFLPINLIEGKAWVVLWPFNKLRLLQNPAYQANQ
ncbi:signal peptidase I [Candidatus Peregrinibacteria bacterium]|nr:signal peptidase I [Candidatus Peregrinibacteria bacterium]